MIFFHPLFYSMMFLVQNIKDQYLLDAFHSKAEIPETRKKPRVVSNLFDKKFDALSVNQPRFRQNFGDLLVAEEAPSVSRESSSSESSPVIDRLKKEGT